MVSTTKRPIIVGTGLTGLAISRLLSRDRVDHLLIGQRPLGRPTLGESLDLTATLDLMEQFPEQSAFYNEKSRLEFWIGEQVASCDLHVARQWRVSPYFRLSGYPVPSYVFHVNRARFDPAVFESVVADSHCSWVDELVESATYDANSDAVSALQLSSGESLPVASAFDATSYRGPVASAAGLKCDWLSSMQIVAFAHYRVPSELNGRQELQDWQRMTSLVRLLENTDGVDGVAWLIPVGDTVSIGISVEADDWHGSADELQDVAEECYQRRGFPVPAVGCASERCGPISFRHRYFMHPRVCGGNWMLAGPSACQVWFMSGSGVGVGFAAARIAKKFIDDPVRYGALYQKYVDGLMESHGILHDLRYGESIIGDAKPLRRLWDRILHSNIKRTTRYSELRENRVGTRLGNLAFRLADRRLILRDYCSIRRVPPALPCHDRPMQSGRQPENARCVCKNSSERRVLPTARSVVTELLKVAGGDTPLRVGEDLVHEDVILHFESHTFRGRAMWRRFVRHLRNRVRQRGLRLRCENVEATGDVAVYQGTWRSLQDDSVCGNVRATFRVQDGRVTELWTKRENYAAVFGQQIRSRWGFARLALDGLLWAALPRREASTTSPPTSQQTPSDTHPASGD